MAAVDDEVDFIAECFTDMFCTGGGEIAEGVSGGGGEGDICVFEDGIEDGVFGPADGDGGEAS